LIDLSDAISFDFDIDVRLFISDRYANLTELDVEVLQAAMIHELHELHDVRACFIHAGFVISY
jgi:hypothetical protein